MGQNMIIRSEEAMQHCATQYAQKLTNNQAPRCIALSGSMGAGKSVFARALIRTLCEDVNLNVPSPTFTLVQDYDSPLIGAIFHYDLYRLEGPEELIPIGWEDSLYDGLCIVEWPEKAGALLPVNASWVTITPGENDIREVTFND